MTIKAHLQVDGDFRFEIHMQKKEKLYKIHTTDHCRKCVEQGIYSGKLRREMAYRCDGNEIWNSSKVYVSAILDSGDKSIVSFVIGHSNNKALVFETFDFAHKQHPDAKPIFHSDCGFQYITKPFKKKLEDAEMVKSMSRVSRCIDNGPMEAFWEMLKSEMYYLKMFHSYEELKQAVTEYVEYYSTIMVHDI